MRLIMIVISALLMFVQVSAASAQEPAQTENDPRWGVLGDMAEHDWVYTGFGGFVMSARWDVPGQKLTFSNWGSLGSFKTSFELDPKTGQLIGRIWGPEDTPTKLRVASDGSVTAESKGEQVPFVHRDADSYWFRYPNGRKITFHPLPQSDPKYAKLAKVIAAGKERAADPSRSFQTPFASAVVAPPMATTPQQARDEPASSIAPAIAAGAAATGPRYALVIGNAQYGAALGRLPNPVNDAQSVAAALKAVGFNVDLVTDADQRAMKRAISRFGERLESAGHGATALFYYAGHGVQSRGTNYLIPVSAPIEREADLDLEAVAADTVLTQMEEAGATTSIVILDACRNMPLSRSLRGASRGLARMDAPNGSFVAYSTAPGATAEDGDGRNSPFAAALVKQIAQKGTPIEVMFRGIRRQVVEATAGQQTPWDSSSLLDPFYFVP